MPQLKEHPATKPMLEFVAMVQRSAKAGRTQRYMARVDEHLADLSRDEALAFLRGELDKWMSRYQRFSDHVLIGRDVEGTSFDYATTIAAIGAKIARLERIAT